MRDFIGILIVLTLLGLIFSKGLERHEIQECEIWGKQSNMFEGWYSVSWQREQCSHYNIDLK